MPRFDHSIAPVARLLLLLLAGLGAAPARAAAPAVFGFRGDLTGRFLSADPPREWSPKTLKWKAPLGGWGNSSPVVAGGRVFVTVEPYSLVALDGQTGRELWRRKVSKADTLQGEARARMEAMLARLDAARREREAKADESRALKLAVRKKSKDAAKARARLTEVNAQLMALDAEIGGLEREAPRIESLVGTASATPVTDGTRVCACWGNFVVSCHDLDGKLLWARDVHDDVFKKTGYLMNGHFEGQAASPWIHDGKLIVPLGKLRLLELATGRDVWEQAPYRDYGTVAIAASGSNAFLLEPSGQLVSMANGATIGDHWGRIRFVAPLAEGDIFYFVGGYEQPTRTLAAAMQLTGPDGELRTLWREERSIPEPYGGTLVDGDHLWILSFLGDLVVLSRADGSIVHRRKLGWSSETPYASPTLTAEGVYVLTQDGKGAVLDRKPPFGVKRRLELGEQIRSSPVFVGRGALVRGLSTLYFYEKS